MLSFVLAGRVPALGADAGIWHIGRQKGTK